MNNETVNALLGSINKWKRIAAGDGEDRGRDNCALCDLFHPFAAHRVKDADRVDCDGCPVFEKTGLNFCDGTPYYHWDNHFAGNRRAKIADSDEARALAKAELDFLISLLPEEYRSRV